MPKCHLTGILKIYLYLILSIWIKSLQSKGKQVRLNSDYYITYLIGTHSSYAKKNVECHNFTWLGVIHLFIFIQRSMVELNVRFGAPITGWNFPALFLLLPVQKRCLRLDCFVCSSFFCCSCIHAINNYTIILYQQFGFRNLNCNYTTIILKILDSWYYEGIARNYTK